MSEQTFIVGDVDPRFTDDEIRLLKALLIELARPKPRTGTDLEGNPMLPVAGEVVDSPWGQAAVERLVLRYSTEAVRDASIPSPDEGQLCHVEELGEFQMWDGSGWVEVGTLIHDQLTIKMNIPGIFFLTPNGSVAAQIYWNASDSNIGAFIFEKEGVPIVSIDDDAVEFTGSVVGSSFGLGPKFRTIDTEDSAVPSGGASGDMAAVISGSNGGVWYNVAGTWTRIADLSSSGAVIQPIEDRIADLEAKVAALEARLDGP